jgi:hypothetical protein
MPKSSSALTQPEIRRLDKTIGNLYPDCSARQVAEIRNNIINYVSQGLADGYDLALIKNNDTKKILKVLKIVQEEN